MAPNFLSKFVKANGTLGSPSADSNHTRSRTISDAGSIQRGRTISGLDTGSTPKVVLTSDNNDSPVLPNTPGSIHRADSPRDPRPRSPSRARSDRSKTTPISTPRRSVQDIIEMPHTTSPENDPPAGLGIDLGQPVNAAQSAVLNGNVNGNGNEEALRRKSSSRSLKNKRGNGEIGPVQEVVSPQSIHAIVESPTSDAMPSSAGFPTPSETNSSTFTGFSSSTSTTTQSSLQPRGVGVADSDAVSIASSAAASSKKMPWRRTSAGSGKKRKPTGLASAIAASGLAMANPGVSQSFAHIAPPPQSPPKSPPKRSFSGPRRSSTAARTAHSRQPSGAHSRNGGEANGDGEFYSDMSSDSEDELDLNEDDIPVTGFAVASSKRNADFHEMFQSVPEGDYLIEDYGCALQREILIQGRLYISENHICFHANIFGWITDLTIPVYEIISIEKKMTALFIPNAIQITTRAAKYTFASFLSRDTTYDVIHNIWRLARPDAESIRSGEVSARVSLDETPILEGSISPESGLEERQTLKPGINKVTQCKCSKEGKHLNETAMTAVFPGTPEKIFNLMFASGFIKDFMRDDQKLKDIQISDWCPDPESNLLSRNFSYIKPLSGGVGPKQTKCELKDETVYCDFDDHIITLTTTRTPDVPSGGAFAVKTRTCIMWASSATTKVVVTTQVDWTGRSFIKSIINNSAIEGQKQYHNDLERAMRAYIGAHKTEFIPEGMEDVVETSPVVEKEIAQEPVAGVSAASISEEEASKRREQERNQRATQWAFDTIMGAWKVAKQSTCDALELVGDAWDQSSSTTILWFVIVVLVISNLWTLLKVGRREEVGRRKEMIKVEEQKKWVASIVAALWEERLEGRRPPLDMAVPAVPVVREDWREEVGEIDRALDLVEDRLRHLRRSLQDLD